MAKIDLSEDTVARMSYDEVTRLPESFGIEYLNTQKLSQQLSAMGAVFTGAGPIDENRVYAERVMNDGTKIRIEATKGEKYKSPKEIAEDIRVRIKEAEGKSK